MRNNVRSRAWGAAIDYGCSFRVERCHIVKVNFFNKMLLLISRLINEPKEHEWGMFMFVCFNFTEKTIKDEQLNERDFLVRVFLLRKRACSFSCSLIFVHLECKRMVHKKDKHY